MTGGAAGPALSGLAVDECPDCEARYVDERRCPDCQLFCRRVDLGGLCPHCDEPVTIGQLTESNIPVSGSGGEAMT